METSTEAANVSAGAALPTGTEFPDPLHPFATKNIGPEISFSGMDLSFSNSALWMLISASVAFLLVFLGSRRKSLVPDRTQSFVEMLYNLVAGMVKENVGNQGRPFFPFVFTLFMFVLFCNTLSLIPGSFAPTAQIAITLTLAAMVMSIVTITGFVKHGLGFLKLFVPKDVPIALLFLIVPVEIFSYLARLISLSIRLFANIFAGHMMMEIFASFVVVFGFIGGLGLIVDVALYPFELFVSFIQAYIFAILTCIYLNDAVHLH